MSTEILLPTPTGIKAAADALRTGEIVGIPTETVYGLGAIADDPRAIARVFAAKERPLFDPLIAHLADPGALAEVAAVEQLEEPGRAAVRALADALWPGPLTLVLPRREWVPDLATAGLATVAVRVPAHPVARALIAAAGAPVVAPSANRFGRISPTSAEDVVRELDGRVRYVLDGGRCAVGVESTIVRVDPDGALTLLRPGGVPVERIAAVVGRVPGAAGGAIEAPGQLPSHYAPRTPLVVAPGPIPTLSADWLRARPGPVGVLAVAGPVEVAVDALRAAGLDVVGAVALTERGDPEEAARRLFAAMRELDASGAAWLLAEPWPDPAGLGHAIRDRLARASAGLVHSAR
jgi:L-threonylcarbamoyladenylate synthase